MVGLAGNHPLRGPNLEGYGPRFLALSDAYDLDLRRRVHRAWREIKQESSSSRELHEGVRFISVLSSLTFHADCSLQ